MYIVYASFVVNTETEEDAIELVKRYNQGFEELDAVWVEAEVDHE